jgi:hypothetical protein
MFKSFLLKSGILALAIGAVVGCSDSSVVAPSDSQTVSSDPYEYLKVDPAEFTDFSEIPTADQVFSDDFFAVVHKDSSDTNRDGGIGHGKDDHRDSSDTNQGGGIKPGKGDTRDSATKGGGKPPLGDPKGGPGRGDKGGKGHGRDFGGLKRGSYERIIAQLGLTAEQDASIRLCFEAKRSCDSTSAADYRAARKTAMDAMHDAMAEIRTQVEAGTMTKDEARAAIAELQQSYRAEVQGLLTTLNAGMASCKTAFESCVEAILTADQLAIWERLTA